MITGCRAALVVVLTCGALGAGGGRTPAPSTRPTVSRAQTVMPVQVPARGEPVSPKETGTAVVGGTIVGADDSTPLAARVTLLSAMLAAPRVTIAGSDGAFEFASLPAGVYNLAVTHTGYAVRRYDEQAPGPAKLITLVSGERRTGITITLRRAGVIAGTLLDADGRPLAAATIDALVSRTEDGRPAPVRAARVPTDDHGEFRVAGLPAGRYYLAAFDPASAGGASQAGSMRYAPSYYPGVPLASQATPIDLAAGEGAGKVVFRLRSSRPARVSGTLQTQDRRPLLSGAVVMSPVRGETILAVSPPDVRILPDGSFVFRNVLPGRYQIRGRGEVEGQSTALFATYALVVEGPDIQNVDMMLLPGTPVAGTLSAEGTGKAPAFAGVRIRAPFLDGTGFGDSLTGDVRPDGSFRIRGVMGGAHVLKVEGLPSAWLLKSVVYRGLDITDPGFEAVSTQPLADVRITITNVATNVSGIVRDATGAPAPGALVIVVPLADQFWSRMSRHIGIARTDTSGRYQVRGLPAGEYRAVASADLDEADAYRRALLQDISILGRPVSLGAAESRQLDLSTIPGAILRPFAPQ